MAGWLAARSDPAPRPTACPFRPPGLRRGGEGGALPSACLSVLVVAVGFCPLWWLPWGLEWLLGALVGRTSGEGLVLRGFGGSWWVDEQVSTDFLEGFQVESGGILVSLGVEGGYG